MFGYIMPDKPELRIKEYELFRAYYCGVCKALGRSFGLMPRMVLNYDSVFLGLFLSSLHGEVPKLKKEVCIANPIQKKWMAYDSRHIDFAADINIILTYYKLKDNWTDEKSLLSLGAYTAFKGAYVKARERNKEVDEAVGISIHKLSSLENNGCSSLDEVADCFADMMKKLLVSGYDGKDAAAIRALEWIGYHIGRWIYIIDAYDDMEKDLKTGSYNPILLQYGSEGKASEVPYCTEVKKKVEFGLTHSLSQIAASTELLDIRNKGIIDNILYLGLSKKTQQILNKCRKRSG